jgi:nitrous oxide reductase accessory protein NosL
MSAKPYTFRESDAARAMRLAKKNGLKVTGFHIMRDGIVVMTEGANMPAPASNPWDTKDASDPPRAA